MPILLAVVMLLAVFGFGGASCALTLQQRLDNVGSQVYVVLNDDYALFVDIDTLLEELAELHDEILQLEGDNTPLLARVDGYKVQLRELRTELEQPREIPFEIEFFDTRNASGMRMENPLRVVDNFADLYTVIYENCPVSAVIETYSAAFFEDNILVVVTYTSGSNPAWFHLGKAENNNTKLSFRLYVEAGQMAAGTVFVSVIELQRRHIRNTKILEVFVTIAPHQEAWLIGYTNL